MRPSLGQVLHVHNEHIFICKHFFFFLFTQTLQFFFFKQTRKTLERAYHTIDKMPLNLLSSQVLICAAIFGALIGISYLPVANTFSFDLTGLFYDDEDIYDGRPVFPRRNLIEEYGEIQYRCLVDSALSVDGGYCLNGDLEKSQLAASSPTAAPTDYVSSKAFSNEATYGVDHSFPTHWNFPTDKSKMSSEMIAKSELYDNYLLGCRDYYRKDEYACVDSEKDRLEMNRNQPPVMQNYTTFGFQKTKAPSDLMKSLKEFMNNNKEDNYNDEKWHPGDTHINHWKSKTYLLNVQDPRHIGGGMRLKNQIWNTAKDILSDWVNKDNTSGSSNRIELSPASLYGIRTYTKGSILAPHVDRLPLVISAIINVDQNLEKGEEWPLEIYGHDGVAYNVTLQPGEMLLYESASIIHGRPYPFQGKTYSNVFVHFEPAGHCSRHMERMKASSLLKEDTDELYKRSQRKQRLISALKKKEMAAKEKSSSGGNSEGGVETVKFRATEIPFYVPSHYKSSSRWKQEIEYKKNVHDMKRAVPNNRANDLASWGDLVTLKKLAQDDKSILFQGDSNGWQPIHEAARAGRTEVIKYLIEEGANVNVRTNFGRGASPLWWAEERNGYNHESASVLRKAGAKRIGPN